jgi:arrestin (S-antigen)-like protein
MIFNFIKGGTDLSFDISIDKEEYNASETVKGKLAITTKKNFKIRDLRLIAEGSESTNIRAKDRDSMRYSSSTNTSDWDTMRTYTENNIFFSYDLSQLLGSIFNDNNNIRDTDTEKEIVAGTNQEIPFEFTIPKEVLPSYNGKNASVTYVIKATADRPKNVDVNKKVSFRVLNPNYNTLYDNDNHNKISSSSEKIDMNNDSQTGIGKGISTYDTPDGFQMSIDLKSFMGKKHDNFIIEGTKAKFDLTGTNKFSRGDIIKGNILVLDEKAKTKGKDISITLYGIERAVAQGLQRITTVEKYESKIKMQPGVKDLNISGDIIFSDNGYATFPFEIQIPNNTNVSYKGRYSEYYWGLEAKINLPWSSDVYARSIVEVVY